MSRALWSCDNCYNIPNFRATGHLCKTNLPANTACRGFGTPQGLMAVENTITDIAAFLHISPHKVGYSTALTSLQSALARSHHLRAFATDVAHLAWSVCLCACLCDWHMGELCQKTAEPIGSIWGADSLCAQETMY